MFFLREGVRDVYRSAVKPRRLSETAMRGLAVIAGWILRMESKNH